MIGTPLPRSSFGSTEMAILSQRRRNMIPVPPRKPRPQNMMAPDWNHPGMLEVSGSREGGGYGGGEGGAGGD
eukprot:5455520-Prymnesium_polylepis.1